MDKRKTSKKKTMLEKKTLRETHSCLGTEIYMHVTPTSSILYIYIYFSFLHQKADPSNYPKVYTCTLKSVLSVYILTMNIPSLLCIVILSETVHVIQMPIVVSLQQLLTSSSLCARDSYKHYICGQFYIYSCYTSF